MRKLCADQETCGWQRDRGRREKGRMGDVGRKGFQEERKKRRMRFWEEDEGGWG